MLVFSLSFGRRLKRLLNGVVLLATDYGLFEPVPTAELIFLLFCLMLLNLLKDVLAFVIIHG